MSKTAAIIFRHDLRLQDNPALHSAYSQNDLVIPIVILDDFDKVLCQTASGQYLAASLRSLDQKLRSYHSQLVLLKSEADLSALLTKYEIKTIYWNRDADPMIQQDLNHRNKRLSKQVKVIETANSNLIDPDDILNLSGNPYKVFTAFWKRIQKEVISKPLSNPKISACTLIDESLLIPKAKYSWQKKLHIHIDAGEDAAWDRLKTFIKKSAKRYNELRDFPSVKASSGLSSSLHYGEISPIQIWHYAIDFPEVMPFLRQLAWREFAIYCLHFNPSMDCEELVPKYRNFPWAPKNEHFERWTKGQTGYPIVDAGMRQLWQTGHMHNRVRMICASFLVKDLLVDWRHGLQWFDDCLLDADRANNSFGWQWVAGCGYDAAPFFRIFNPTRQSEKFDGDGLYIRQWLPELKSLPAKFLHQPRSISMNSGLNFELKKDYYPEIVCHKEARNEALRLLKTI